MPRPMIFVKRAIFVKITFALSFCFALLPAGAASAEDKKADKQPEKKTPPQVVSKKDSQLRQASDPKDLRYWLENMVVAHGYTLREMSEVTGLSAKEVQAALKEFGLAGKKNPPRRAGEPLRMLPYPGGRHPRIGFLDGAVDPQRETKLSVFTPWDEKSYVVVDLPEALWSNLGLTYLAHTHVPTVWSKQGIELARQEWERRDNGSFYLKRKLPNGIVYTAQAKAHADSIAMELTLTNGTREKLSDLRVQNCVMLKGAPEFAQQTNDNKIFRTPYVACRSADGKRWVITAWERCGRAWGNAPCPCLHSDPVFEECSPGETKRLRGRLWFYEGTRIEEEFRRLDATDWDQDR